MFCIWDGSYYIARAQARLGNLTSKDGFPTGGIFGGINMISSDLSKIQPEYGIVVFDNSSDEAIPERTKVYADYKQNRAPKNKEEVTARDIKHRSRKVVKDVLSLCGIRAVFAHSGWEADDTIGSLAVCAANAGQKVLVLTGDKDIAQVVTESIRVLDTKTTDGTQIKDHWKEALNPAHVEEKYGVHPKRIVDLLALNGDAVDNIPGVPGITRESAAELIARFGSLKGVFNAFSSGEDIGINRKKATGFLDNSKFLKRNINLASLNTKLIDEARFNLTNYRLKQPEDKDREEAAKILQNGFQFKGLPASLVKYLDSRNTTSSLRSRASMFD